MTTGNAWRRERAARDLATHLGKTRAVDPVVESTEPLTEAARTCWRRRLQQRKCLMCGARDLVNHGTSYFCATHRADWRYCSTCETLRPLAAHGKSWTCNSCANIKATARYHADPEPTLYRLRLQQLAKRTQTREDQIFMQVRKRIVIADLVKRTPGLSWTARGALIGRNAKNLSREYRDQCAGRVFDMDRPDSARRRRSR